MWTTPVTGYDISATLSRKLRLLYSYWSHLNLLQSPSREAWKVSPSPRRLAAKSGVLPAVAASSLCTLLPSGCLPSFTISQNIWDWHSVRHMAGPSEAILRRKGRSVVWPSKEFKTKSSVSRFRRAVELMTIRFGGIAARKRPIGRKAASAFKKSLKLSFPPPPE